MTEKLNGFSVVSKGDFCKSDKSCFDGDESISPSVRELSLKRRVSFASVYYGVSLVLFVYIFGYKDFGVTLMNYQNLNVDFHIYRSLYVLILSKNVCSSLICCYANKQYDTKISFGKFECLVISNYSAHSVYGCHVVGAPVSQWSFVPQARILRILSVFCLVDATSAVCAAQYLASILKPFL